MKRFLLLVARNRKMCDIMIQLWNVHNKYNDNYLLYKINWE